MLDTILFIKKFMYLHHYQTLRAGQSVDRIPVGARCSAPVQTGCEPHPTFYTMGTGYFFCYGTTTLIEYWPSQNILPFKAVLDLFCPLNKLHLLQVILDIVFPTGLGPSCWSTCEWFPFVYSFLLCWFQAFYLCVQTNSIFGL